MRAAILTLIVFIALTGCKRGEQTSEPEPSATALSLALKDLRGVSSREHDETKAKVYEKDLDILLSEQKNALDSAIFYTLARKPEQALQLLERVDTTRIADSLTLVYHLVHGRSCLQLEDCSRVNNSVEKMLAISSNDVDALNLKAACQIVSGKPDEALIVFKKLLSIDPNHAQALYGEAMILNEMNRSGEALFAANRLLKLESSNPLAYNMMGLTLTRLGRHAEAIAYFDSLMILEPDAYYVYDNRARPLHGLRKNNEALAMLDSALQLKPGLQSALEFKAFILFSQNRMKEALAAIDDALIHNPGSASLHYNKACVLARQRDKTGVMENLKTALEANPDWKSHAQADPDFSHYHKDTEFRKVVGLK